MYFQLVQFGAMFIATVEVTTISAEKLDEIYAQTPARSAKEE
jgi:hypothetical protein